MGNVGCRHYPLCIIHFTLIPKPLSAPTNRPLMGDTYCNSPAQNLSMGLVVVVTAVLGGWNVWLAFQ